MTLFPGIPPAALPLHPTPCLPTSLIWLTWEPESLGVSTVLIYSYLVGSSGPNLIHGYTLLEKSLGIGLNYGKIVKSAVPNPLHIKAKESRDAASWHLGHLGLPKYPALWQCAIVVFVDLLRSCHGSCQWSPVWCQWPAFQDSSSTLRLNSAAHFFML